MQSSLMTRRVCVRGTNMRQRRLNLRRSLAAGLLVGVDIFGSVAIGHAQEPIVAVQKLQEPVVGILANGGPDPAVDAVRRALVDAGLFEKRDIRIEMAFAHGDAERLPALAAELGQRKSQVIISLGAIGVLAARKSVPQIPVVFAGVLDPIAAGFTSSTDRPDRNITGITTFDELQPARQMQMLKKVIPKLARVAILSDVNIPRTNGINPLEDANERAARDLGLHVDLLKLTGPTPDLDGAFAAIKSATVDAVVVLDVPVPILHQKRIAQLALSQGLPTLFLGGRRMADSGGLIAYGTGLLDTIPLIPDVVSKILNGQKPAEIPFQIVAKKTLVLNLATARALGVTIPADIIAQADRTIE